MSDEQICACGHCRHLHRALESITYQLELQFARNEKLVAENRRLRERIAQLKSKQGC